MAVTPDSVYGDSQWLRENPALISRFSQILVNSGIVPDQATLQKYGLSSLFDPSVSAAAANNPYSTAKLLAGKRDYGLYANGTRASVHGGLFSGAFQNSQDQTGRDYQQAYSQAGAQGLSALLGVQGDQNSLYNSIFQRKLGETPAADPTVYPGSVSIGGEAGAPAPGGREIARPGIQVNPWHVPDAQGNALTTVKKKPGFSSRAL